MFPPHSRLCRTFRTNESRRLTSAAGKAAAVGLALALPAACSNGDESTFAATTELATDSAPATGSTATAATASENAVIPDDAVVPDSAVVPDNAELVVSFTYQASSTDRAKRPYIAVWVEDSDGELVDTISLWYQQDGKGTKWLDDLRQWYSVANGSDTTMSGATRVAGDYIVSWDGTDAQGSPITQGEYTLYIESSREHGPYSLSSAALSIGDSGFVVTLDGDEELSALSAQYIL